ncbi:hypothetical protein, partial [Pseudophaeobacter arcticus]|uniref:hypothetical protein n=1 Tax=Pseudophaeobacter arcticus TaxID=385492 RepID=UPI0024930177
SGRLLRRPRQHNAAATVAEYCSADYNIPASDDLFGMSRQPVSETCVAVSLSDIDKTIVGLQVKRIDALFFRNLKRVCRGQISGAHRFETL